MWIAKLSDATLRTIVFCEFIVFIIVPNVLVRAIEPHLIRPLFFTAGQITVAVFMVLALIGETYKWRLHKNYGANKNNRPVFWLAVFLGVIFVPILLFDAGRVCLDLFAYQFEGAPLRQVTATAEARTGFPLTYVFPDDLTLDNGNTVHISYSDLPQIGQRYTFILLPTQDIVLSYQPVAPL